MRNRHEGRGVPDHLDTPGPSILADSGAAPPRTGATVLLLRATAFYMPREVRIRVGEKVVWFYADGSRDRTPSRVVRAAGLIAQAGGRRSPVGRRYSSPGSGRAHLHTRDLSISLRLNTATMQATVIVSP